MTFRHLTKDEVKFSISINPDYACVRGNVSATDDPEYDKQVEDRIIERINGGEVLAWCQITVMASWQSYEASDTIGCCSFENWEQLEEFTKSHQMQETALERLNEKIKTEYLLLQSRFG